MNIKDIITESKHKCPHCGGPMFSEMMMMEKKDACYYKVKASAKVWPSAYASGRLVQCRKKGAGNYGNKSEGRLNEFAPGSGGGESGRWYTDDQMTDLVGDGWYNDLDVSGDIPKQQMIQQAQAWLDDQGYSVQVLNCKVNDDDMEWYIEGSFQNSRFAKKGVAEQQLDEKCWDGYQQQGMKNKGGRQVPNCVPNESVEEAKLATMRDYYSGNKDAKDKTKLSQMRDYFSKTDPADSPSQNTAAKAGKPYIVVKRKQYNMAEELAEEFDLIENIIDNLADQNGVDADMIWEDLESLTDDELYVFAVTSQLNEDWQKANKRDKTDGMSQKAVNAYRRENPGSKLKTAVTTKPSKLKKGGKASKRRKSYCSRSRGQMKMHSISCAKTPDKAICKARRRWNC